MEHKSSQGEERRDRQIPPLRNSRDYTLFRNVSFSGEMVGGGIPKRDYDGQSTFEMRSTNSGRKSSILNPNSPNLPFHCWGGGLGRCYQGRHPLSLGRPSPIKNGVPSLMGPPAKKGDRELFLSSWSLTDEDESWVEWAFSCDSFGRHLIPPLFWMLPKSKYNI